MTIQAWKPPEQVTITDDEAAALRQARVVLKQIEARMWKGADDRRVGLVLHAATAAESAIFHTLNLMRAYLHAPLTDEQMFL